MGNAISPCFHPNSTSIVKLVFYEGTTRILTGKPHLAGEIMFEFPDRMVCNANSFFIGHPVPALSIDDELAVGQTYFVLPLDCFPCNVLSAASFSSLISSPKRATPVNFKECPFEYINGSNGRVLIKVSPEFMIKLLTRGTNEDSNPNPNPNPNPNEGFLCSTPELKKHYDMLVGSKGQSWSPKLDTISEYKIRFSPCKYIGLEWKEKEHQV